MAARFLVITALVGVTFAYADSALPSKSSQSLSVTLHPALDNDADGRLLVFAKFLLPGDAAPAQVDISEYVPTAVAVAARDVKSFGPKHRVEIDLEDIASPKPFSALTPGNYRVQVVLDRDGDYARYGRGAGDFVSETITLRLPLNKTTSVELNRVLPTQAAGDFTDLEAKARVNAARTRLTEVTIPSPSLSVFWGRPISLSAWVLVPPNYNRAAKTVWPVFILVGQPVRPHVKTLRPRAISLS